MSSNILIDQINANRAAQANGAASPSIENQSGNPLIDRINYNRANPKEDAKIAASSNYNKGRRESEEEVSSRAYQAVQEQGYDIDTWYSKAEAESNAASERYNQLKAQLDELKSEAQKDENSQRFAKTNFLAKLLGFGKSADEESAQVSNLDKAVKQAQAEADKKSEEFRYAKQYKDYRDISSSVEAAREGASSYNDLIKSYSQSLDQLNKARATALEDLNRIKNGAGYYGAASTYEEDKARQEADEKDALARLEAAEKQIQRVTGMRDYAFARSANDKGAEAVIRQGEELARTAKEQYLAGNMPDPTSNADYRTWVENNPGKTARDYAEQQYADREPNDMWTQEEKNRYFILMTDSPERAFQYAVEINSAINSETNAAAAERFAKLFPNYDMSEEARAGRSGITNALMGLGNEVSDIAGIAGGVATGPVKLFNWLDNIYQNNERGGYYAGNSTPRITDYTDRLLGQNAERMNDSYGTIRDDVPILGGKGLGDLYQLVESVAQSMAYGAGLTKAFGVGATTAAGLNAAQQAAKLSTGLIFFGQAADSSYNEYVQRGMSREQAAVGSFFAGLAEAMGEELSIDHLISGDISEGLAKYVAKQSFIEASEEGFTNVLNLFGDELAARMTGGESKMRQDIEALKRSGMSEEDAKRQVWKEFVDSTVFDMLGGAISGGLSSGAYAAPNALYNYVQNRNNQNQQNQQTAQPSQQTQTEASQRPTTRNPLYEALNPQTPAAETATVAENATTEEPAPATQPTAETPQAPTAETTTPTAEAATQPQATETVEMPQTETATAEASVEPAPETAPTPAPATTTPTSTETEQSAGTIPASEQTTAERTNGQGPQRERNMSRNLRGNEKAEPDLRNSFEENRDLYTQLTNAEVAAKAAEIVGKGYDVAKNDIYEKIGQAKAGAKLAPEYAVAGYQLANEMVRRGEIEAARELCADIAAELTYAGQVGQIGRLILESDPSIRIKTVDKIVDKINGSMTEGQKAKNKKRSGGKESARKANEAAQAAQKQAAEMVANALSGGDTFNFPDAAAKEVAGSIKAQIKRVLSPQKPRNALDTFVSYVKKFAREKINVGEKSKPMTSTELLREVVNNEELFMEVYEKAQAEFMGEDATGYREFVEDYVNTPVGIDGTGDARNKLFMQAIVESATATSENAKTIRTQAALGVPHGEIANRIADALIQETGATGGIADSIRGSAQAYVNEIINSDEKTGDSRAEGEVTSIMQAIGVKFREMAVQNKAAKDAVRRDIANMLATEYALSPDSAEKIAQSVANEYDRQLSDAMAKEVEKRFAPKEKRSKAEAKALTQQLTEAINLGTFSSDYATEAVNKIFGVDGTISVSDEALQRYAAAETKEEQNAALDAIEQEIADQIPATFRDKFTALRYLNMLGNLKTQARNVVGNAAMMTATNVKYLTQHVLELARAAATGGEYQGNTALNTSKELRQQAAADFEANKDEIEGDAKYSDVGRQAAKSIQKKRQIFGTTGNALWDNTVGRGLEGARTLTNKAMEVGDEIFLRQVYVRSFAGWMKAHGVTDVNNASPEQVSAAREFAKKEAQEATFHDSNQFSEFVTSIDANWDKGHSKKVNEIGAAAKMITQGIMPFRRTTANVAVRAVEYSPVGFAMSAIQAARGADAAQTINNLAKSVTGTVLFRAGMLLAAAGRARASGDDEDEKLNNFKKLQGEMDYSVKVGDKYISLSQLAPMAIPFFMGVKLNELLEYSDNLFSADSIGDILGVVSEPMLEMSMLSGVNDFLNDLSSLNGDTDALPSLIGNAALSYLSQGLTNSLLGQLEQASERNRQTTYSDTKSADATGFDRFLGKNQYKIGKYSAKIPGIDYNQQDYVDAWGRTQSNGGVGERAFNAFLNPTYTGKDRSTDVDEELERLYRDNKGKGDFPDVFPQKRSRSDVIGDGVVMTPDEYLAFSQESGQKKLELVREFMQSSDYKNLTDEQRAETIHNLYAFADATALQKVRDANGVTVENKYAKIADLTDVPAYLAATERFKADAEKEGTTFNGWTNTNFEKYISSGLKDEDLDVLAGNALSDARKPVYDLMREVGMSPKEYMDAITTMDGEKHDGQFKQADVYNWLTKNTTMSTEQKNQLWDMLGNNWKTSFSNYKPK